MIRTLAAFALLALPSLAACSRETPAPPPAPAATTTTTAADAGAASAGDAVVLLVTGNENGQVVAGTGEGAPKVGAAEVLGHWTTKEHHCAGPVAKDGAAACEGDPTIALSTGDHWSGAPMATFFAGEPAAEAMARMGYAASAIGNRDFDYGREAFAKDVQLAHVPHVAANVTVDEKRMPGLAIEPFRVVRRGALAVGVVGLASSKTVTSTMPARLEGLTVRGYEEALADAVPKAWAAGANAVVVVAHECPAVLEPIVAKHAEWKIALVAGACRTETNETKDGVVYASAGRGFEHYLRAEVRADKTSPRGASVRATDVTVSPGDAKPDADLARAATAWQKKLDSVLGEEIGVSASGLAADKGEVGRWAATALRDVTKADVVVLNKSGVRANVPKGKVTRSDVYAALPFQNSVMILKAKGSDLEKVASDPKAIVLGPAKLDPAKTYRVATVDFLYFGGDGFALEKIDPDPIETGMMWQTAVIDWTKGKKTSAASPIEQSVSLR